MKDVFESLGAKVTWLDNQDLKAWSKNGKLFSQALNCPLWICKYRTRLITRHVQCN